MTVKEPNSRGADEVEEENDGSPSLLSLSPSPSSSETESSPRRRRKGGKQKKGAHLHSQVLRVREEDSHIGEDDIMEGYCGKVVNSHLSGGAGSPLKSGVSLSRPSMLPCSPLSGKIATVNSLRLHQDVGGV